MSKDEKYEELRARRKQALEMGGQTRIKKQHARGKLTVRERIDLLLDPGTFGEYGLLATHRTEIGHSSTSNEISPADGVVVGFGKIDGRSVCVVGEDFTVKGGTFGIVHGRKKLRAIEIAHKECVPVIWIQDGAGARAQEMIGEGYPSGPHYAAIARHSGTSPQVCLIMGPSAGDSSLIASLCQMLIMVDGTSMLAAGGPPIVKAATGQDIDKEVLGGADVHCRVSGVADMRAGNEEMAIAKARQFLSYLPTNAYEYPPAVAPTPPSKEAQEIISSIVPDDPRVPFDMKKVISAIVDDESFFEIKPEHASMLIAGFARIDGHPIGLVANQSLVYAGAITAAAARKARHFIDLCVAYHVPLVFLVDVPGVMPGPEAEREGTLRPGLALTYSLAWADIPVITVVTRKAFGFGACAMGGGGSSGQDLVLAWPFADFGSLPPSSAVLAAHATEIENSDNPEQLKRDLVAHYERSAGAIHAAETFSVDDIVLPEETRARISQALELARNRRTKSPSPTPRYGVMP